MKKNKPNILVVDDDERLRELICGFLEKNNFNTIASEDAKVAAQKISSQQVDLIVLDVMMPGETGFEFLQKIRTNNNVPVIMLTALGESDDRIKGLKYGADDYLPKPFEPEELVLRIHTVLKRAVSGKASSITFGDFVFDVNSGVLNSKKGDSVYLTSTELMVLKTLINNKNQPVSREYFSKLNNYISERAIDVQITRLRRKLEKDPKKPEYIQTVRNAGYVLKV